jgi:adenosylcobinamide-GDP ribazoletransferase
VRGLKTAASFLTRLRVRGDTDDLSSGVPWFPVVGGLLGLVLAGLYAAVRLGLPSLAAAAITVAFGVWATGAFHEDGLADTADAFGGFRSREEILRILKDPRLGTYGVSALVLSLLLRTAALGALGGRTAFAVLPAAHAMSRAAAVGLLAGPVAPSIGGHPRTPGEGLGSSYAAATSRGRVALALVAAATIGGLALGPLVFAAVAGVALSSLMVQRLARKRIGGVTGDLMGAAQQAGEIVVLLIGAAAVGRGWLSVPWWS